MLLALLAVISLLWGWWELGRSVSLSPLETAKAFGAPMMQHVGRNSTVEEILKKTRGMKVKYDEGILLPTERGNEKEVGRHDHEIQLGESGKNGGRVRVIESGKQER
jgi:hypothetical protein